MNNDLVGLWTPSFCLLLCGQQTGERGSEIKMGSHQVLDI